MKGCRWKPQPSVLPLRFLKRFYRDTYARLRAILRPETIIVFHDGFRLLR